MRWAGLFVRTGRWPTYCALLIGVFLLRAAMVLSILPPFEGWDEYQHVAYIAFIVENGRSPRLIDRDAVPRGLYPALVMLPHCPFDVQQTGGVGTRPYRALGGAAPAPSYWEGSTPRVYPDAPTIPIYQAQHGPLYYWMMTPVYRALWDPGSPGRLIGVLRWINVAFAAVALGLVLGTLPRVIPAMGPRMAVGLLLAVQPLFLLNATRVASDALAVMLGVAAAGLLLAHAPRVSIVVALGAGVLVGLATLAKSVGLLIAPLGVVAPLWLAWRRRLDWRRAAACSGLFVVGLVCVTHGYFRDNLHAYGMLTPMQEAVMNRDAGRGPAAILAAAMEIDWWRELRSRLGRNSLWVGGWSYLMAPHGLRTAHECLIGLAGLGLIGVVVMRRWTAVRNRAARIPEVKMPRSVISVEPTSNSVLEYATFSSRDANSAWWWSISERMFAPDLSAIVVLLALCAGLGIAYHMVQTRVALGTIATNIWYAAVCFPWLIALYVRGAWAWPGFWLRAGLVLAMAGVCLGAEMYGVFALMVPAYAGLPWGEAARSRLASIHAVGPGPGWTAALAVAAGVGAVWCAATWVSGLRNVESPET